jgi:putative endonuclease
MTYDTPASTDDTKTWWVYLLGCADGRTYIGIALDVELRFQTHLLGNGAKFTRSNKPVIILGAQPFSSKSAALKAEYALKQLSRTDKLQWAQQWPCRSAQPLAEV